MVDIKRDTKRLRSYLENLWNRQVDMSAFSIKLTDYLGPSNEPSEDEAILNCANEVSRKCEQQSIDVSPELAEYLVRLKLLNPENSFSARHVIEESLIPQLVGSCVEDLKKYTPGMDMIRLQAYWITKYHNDKERFFKIIEKESSISNNQSLMEEILSNPITTKDDDDRFMTNMVLYFILRSGMGDTTNATSLEETRAALESVFDEPEMRLFGSLSREDKKRKLESLVYCVAGIRLYDKYENRGGGGIEDFAAIATHEQIKLFKMYILIGKRIDHITVALKNAYNLDVARSMPEDKELEVIIPKGYSKPNIDNLQEILAILQQLHLYVKKLVEVPRISIYTDPEDPNIRAYYANDFNINTFQQIHKHLSPPPGPQLVSQPGPTTPKKKSWIRGVLRQKQRSSESIASTASTHSTATKIYEKFVEVGRKREEQQKKFLWVVLKKEIALYVEKFYKYVEPTPIETILCPEPDLKIWHIELPFNEVKYWLEAGKTTIEARQITNPEVTTLGASHSFSPFTSIHLPFSGHCAWTIAQVDGMPINTCWWGIGVLLYSGQQYCFSTASVAYKWAKDPEWYLARAYTNVRRRPWLVELVGLYKHLRGMQDTVLCVDKLPSENKDSTVPGTSGIPPKQKMDKEWTPSPPPPLPLLPPPPPPPPDDNSTQTTEEQPQQE